MKKENAFLAASVLLNAGLVALLAMPGATTPARGSQGPPADARGTPYGSATAATPEVRARAKADGEDDTIVASASAKSARPSSHGVRELVAELRRRGVDEGTVRRLGVAHAERLFRLEARALFSRREKLEYWQSPATSRFSVLDQARLREFQRLRRERVETLGQLFGDVEAEATEHNSVNHFLYDSGEFEFEYAPAEKRLALTEFFEREMLGVARTPVQRLLWQQMPSPPRELEYAAKARDILGPELFDEYLLESSGLSSRLKYELAAMQPTREEFDRLVRAEYELMREQSETLATLRSPDGNVNQASFREAEDARRQVARDVLGDTRYADYERATDEAYRHLDQLARELGLGTSAARAAFAHVERARKQVLDLSPEGANLADPKVMDAMRKIRDQAEDGIADELGLQGLDDVERRTVIGPALSIHPRQISQRMFRWF